MSKSAEGKVIRSHTSEQMRLGSDVLEVQYAVQSIKSVQVQTLTLFSLPLGQEVCLRTRFLQL